MGIFVLDRSTVASDDKIQTKEIEFNPNPVQSNINFETEISSYKIFDLNGNAIQENTKHTSNSIDVSKLLTGMYFIQIYHDLCAVPCTGVLFFDVQTHLFNE